MTQRTAVPPRTRTRPRIGPRSAGIPMTAEEFDAVPESRWVEGYRYELINGVLVVSPPPAMAERDPNDELGHLLRAYRDTHPDLAALDATAPEQTIRVVGKRRRADRAIWTGLGRTPDPVRDLPAILVEFVSARKRDAVRDYETKRDEYLASGVAEYWVIDRFQRKMTVYATTPAGNTERVVLEADSYATPLLPGFVLPLAQLLGRADLWPAKKNQRRRPPA